MLCRVSVFLIRFLFLLGTVVSVFGLHYRFIQLLFMVFM